MWYAGNSRYNSHSFKETQWNRYHAHARNVAGAGSTDRMTKDSGTVAKASSLEEFRNRSTLLKWPNHSWMRGRSRKLASHEQPVLLTNCGFSSTMRCCPPPPTTRNRGFSKL